MTREMAIKVIHKMLAYTDLSVRANLTADMVDACRLAIKALEQEPKLQNRCFALTQGHFCMFCPYDCENRTTEHRSVEE